MLNKFLKREKGITGLETAIILIAFVVVAAVFAYTALSAGLFATQKSQGSARGLDHEPSLTATPRSDERHLDLPGQTRGMGYLDVLPLSWQAELHVETASA